jgi:ABC-2 type transport system permease protein
MTKMFIILRQEIYALTSRFSFWFGVFGLPLIGFTIFAIVNAVNNQPGGLPGPSPFDGVGQLFDSPTEIRPQGLVDQGGLIRVFPDGWNASEIIVYRSSLEAHSALDAGVISAYYQIPPDYLQSGKVTVYSASFDLIQSERQSEMVASLIEYNLLSASLHLYEMQREPITNIRRVSLAPSESSGSQRDQEHAMTFFLPYGVMMFFYMAILGSAGLMLNSISKEKENRILEVLLVSTKATELLMGKIAGLGMVGLLQVLVWASSSLVLLRMSGSTFNLPEAYQLPPSLIAWGALFFVLGYLVYAALMAGIGALVPNLREGSQATTIVILPLIVPLLLINALIDRPNSPLSVGLSLFPLTSPTTMMLRLAAADVPLWQILLALALLAVTALLTVRAVAGMFRAQTLLSGQPFKFKLFLKALVGKA